ncbi:MAG: hypothetical protein ABSB23_14700 [Bryobacteraceae bacterium]|jgi:hypothetical protein
MLTRNDLLSSPSLQDKNAGNSGDLIKHISYLALLRELAQLLQSVKPHIVEAHGGKSVYVSAHRHLVSARNADRYPTSTLGAAQAACFATAPGGVGPVAGLHPGEIAYAGSTALHARAVIDGLSSSLTVLDRDHGVRSIVGRVFSEPCFSLVRGQLQVQDPAGPSEPVILSRLKGGAFGTGHVLHFDPFAFVMAQDKASIRSMYRDLIRECDARVSRGELAAASVFFTWGSNGAAATEDLYGLGYRGGMPNGYQDLVSTVDPEQRIVVRWCWELFFALLFIVPSNLKVSLARAIEADASWLSPLMRRFEVVA